MTRTRTTILTLLLAVLSLCPSIVSAETAIEKETTAATAALRAAEIQEAVIKQETEDSKKNFLGVDFGLGLALTFDGNARIKDAELVNGIVRVKSEERYVPKVTLEGHYFFSIANSKGGCKSDRCGLGPYLAVQTSSDEIVDGVGFGLLTGFRKDATKSESFNFGFGLTWDRQVKQLGDGIRENKPLPSGETAIRFKEKGRSGYSLMFSFSF